jgi:hypothetical protein
VAGAIPLDQPERDAVGEAFFIGGYMGMHTDENMLILHERLLEILHYEPETGIFTWRNRRKFSRCGKITGYLTEKGYVKINTHGKLYFAHRLAWFYMTGVWPIEIDHINRIRSDNRWCNLRNATRIENSRNMGISKNNKSGFKGVRWNTQNHKWQAKAKVNGKHIYLGFFTSIEDAAMAYKTFAEKIHGEFFVGGDGLSNIEKTVCI